MIWLFKSVRDLKHANPFLSVQKAKQRQCGRHMGSTKRHSYPTRAFVRERIRWKREFSKKPLRQISGFKATRRGDSSPVLSVQNTL